MPWYCWITKASSLVDPPFKNASTIYQIMDQTHPSIWHFYSEYLWHPLQLSFIPVPLEIMSWWDNWTCHQYCHQIFPPLPCHASSTADSTDTCILHLFMFTFLKRSKDIGRFYLLKTGSEESESDLFCSVWFYFYIKILFLSSYILLIILFRFLW